MTEHLIPPLTRRGLMGSAAAAGLLLAGCGGSDGDDSGASASEGAPVSGERKRGGTFRMAITDMPRMMDPQSSAEASFLIGRQLSSTLMERAHDYSLRNGIAEEFEPEGNDMSTWTIRLREGVEFHDGKTVGADDVIFSINRIMNPKAPGFVSGLMVAIDPKRMKKLDKRTVRLHLKTPDSQLSSSFAEIPSCILPVGYDPQNPIGCGPFRQTGFTPGRRWTAEGFENYWKSDQGMPYLDGLEMIYVADQNARVNALVSGQADAVNFVLPSQVKQLESRPDMSVVISETGAFDQVEMNCSKGSPFEDPRTRLAFKLMADRQQLLNGAYAGQGGIGNDTGTWTQFDPSYPADLPQREQDLEQARALLKESGQEGMDISIWLAELQPGILATGEILAEQAKAVGINMTQNVVDIQKFYGSEEWYTTPIKIVNNYTCTMHANLLYCLLPDTVFNGSFYDNPQVNSLAADAFKVQGAEYDEKIAEISQIIHDDGPWLVWGRRNIADAMNSKFTGLVPDAAGTGFNGNYVEEISQA